MLAATLVIIMMTMTPRMDDLTIPEFGLTIGL